MKGKDVLMVCQYFYPEYISSAVLPYQTAKHLVREGLNVDVLCGYPHEYLPEGSQDIPKTEVVDGIQIKRIKYLSLAKNVRGMNRILNFLSFIIGILVRIFSFRHYKVIVIYTNPPILAVVAWLSQLFFKSKIVFVSYDVYPEIAIELGAISEQGLISRGMQWFNRKLFPRLTRVVALSQDMKDYLVKHRPIDADKVVVIPNWSIDTSSSLSVDETKETEEGFHIVYLGNMGRAQDLDTVLGLISDQRLINEGVKFTFAGHGIHMEDLQEEIEAKGYGHVEVFDYLQGEAYAALKENADAFLVTLREGVEGLAVPSKYYTYLQTNKPIIAIMSEETDIYRDVQELNLGVAGCNGDVDGLVAGILSLREENIDYRECYQEKFAKEIQLNKYVNLIRQIIKGKER